MPKRIQRKRTKGWRMPAGAVYVGRPTKWGNRYALRSVEDQMEPRVAVRKREARGIVVDIYHDDLLTSAGQRLIQEARVELRGKDLACWCPLDQPCHADVLLELANA